MKLTEPFCGIFYPYEVVWSESHVISSSDSFYDDEYFKPQPLNLYAFLSKDFGCALSSTHEAIRSSTSLHASTELESKIRYYPR